MPGRDGKGPQGAGPERADAEDRALPARDQRAGRMTCAAQAGVLRPAVAAEAGPSAAVAGRALRRPTENETVQNLKNRAAALEQELAEVRSRIEAYSAKNG